MKWMWLEHFQKFVKASSNSKVLLLLDEHSSHKSLQVMIFAKNNAIIHHIQPLDVAFRGPLKTFYSQEIDELFPST